MFKRKIKAKKVIFIIGCAIGVAVLIFYLYSRKSIIDENQRLIDNEMDSVVTYKPCDYEADLEYLNHLLKNKYLTNEQQGIIYSKIAYVYQLNNSSLNFLNNAGYAMYYLEKARNVEVLAREYSDICSYYLEHDAYDKAEEALLDISNAAGGGFRMKDFETYSRYFKYRGCVETQKKQFERAHDDFERARQKLNYEDNSELIHNTIAMINVQEAICYIDEGKYHLASEIINRYRPMSIDAETANARYLVSEYQLPYYEASYRLAHIRNHKAQEERFLMDYFDYCSRYGFYQKRLDIFDMYINPSIRGLASSGDNTDELLSTLDTYDSILNSQSSEIMSISEATLSNSKAEMENREFEKIKQSIIVFLIVVSVLVTVVIIIAAYFVFLQSRTDNLTGLFNRRCMDDAIAKFIEKEQMISAIMIDIDDFKKVNDQYGHDVGDYVLKSIGGILLSKKSCKLKQYRYGGEEFVILSTTKKADEVLQFAELLRSAVEEYNYDYNLHITISVGVARNCKAEDVVQKADQNLYFTKRNGKNNVCYSINEKLVLLN